jgi:hypothetical protein
VVHSHVSVALLVKVNVTLVGLTWVKALLTTTPPVQTYRVPPKVTGELVIHWFRNVPSLAA